MAHEGGKIRVGSKVYIAGNKKKWGTVRYIGLPHFSTGDLPMIL